MTAVASALILAEFGVYAFAFYALRVTKHRRPATTLGLAAIIIEAALLVTGQYK
jgi:hypothetical protein